MSSTDAGIRPVTRTAQPGIRVMLVATWARMVAALNMGHVSPCISLFHSMLAHTHAYGFSIVERSLVADRCVGALLGSFRSRQVVCRSPCSVVADLHEVPEGVTSWSSPQPIVCISVLQALSLAVGAQADCTERYVARLVDGQPQVAVSVFLIAPLLIPVGQRRSQSLLSRFPCT